MISYIIKKKKKRDEKRKKKYVCFYTLLLHRLLSISAKKTEINILAEEINDSSIPFLNY